MGLRGRVLTEEVPGLHAHVQVHEDAQPQPDQEPPPEDDDEVRFHRPHHQGHCQLHHGSHPQNTSHHADHLRNQRQVSTVLRPRGQHQRIHLHHQIQPYKKKGKKESSQK